MLKKMRVKSFQQKLPLALRTVIDEPCLFFCESSFCRTVPISSVGGHSANDPSGSVKVNASESINERTHEPCCDLLITDLSRTFGCVGSYIIALNGIT